MLFKRRNILKSLVLWKSLQHALQRVRFHIRSGQVSNSYLKTPFFFYTLLVQLKCVVEELWMSKSHCGTAEPL